MRELPAAFMMALLLSALVLTGFFSLVQAATMWDQTCGGPDWDEGTYVVETGDGGYAITGRTDSYGSGGEDAWLIKTDAAGTAQWNQTYGGTNDDLGHSLVQTGDGGYVIAGTTLSYGAGSMDVWLIKTDAAGTAQWNQTYGGASYDVGISMIQTSDGGYAITGYTMSFGAGGMDVWLIKTDATGNEQWNQTYGGTDNDLAHSLVQTSDAGFAIAGYTGSFGAGGMDVWLIKTDPAGNEQWNQTYGGTGQDDGLSVLEAGDGGYAIAGRTDSYGAGSMDVWLVKTDESGVVPEASWVILPLLLVATLSIFVSKKKLLRSRSRRR